MAAPINVVWNGEAFEPVNRWWAQKCDARFVVGQQYALDEVHARSSASHGHYFAVLHELFLSLPEHMAEKFPTEDHLRKYALIRKGYRTDIQHVCRSEDEAERLASAVQRYDDYQIVEREGCIVTVYHAMSQDLRSMDRKTFQESKDAVLGWCHDLLGIEREAKAS